MIWPLCFLIVTFPVTFSSSPPQPPTLRARKQDIHTCTSALECYMKASCSHPSFSPPTLFAQLLSLNLSDCTRAMAANSFCLYFISCPGQCPWSLISSTLLPSSCILVLFHCLHIYWGINVT